MTAADPLAEPRFADWSDDFRVGVDDIDEQHRTLFALVHALWDAVLGAPGAQPLDAVFRQLENYTLKHFRDEEMLMAAAGYPDFAEHRRTHARFARVVAETKARYLAGDLPGPETLYFFNNWLVNHIQKDDQRAADFYLERLPPRSWFERIFRGPGAR